MEITISNVGPGDYATLARLFSFLSGSGIEVRTAAGTADLPRKQPGRKPRAAAARAPEPTAPAVETEDAAATEDALLERFSGWHASQKGANGKGRYYSKAQVAHYLPLWNAAKAEYLRIAGPRAASGRTFKSWSINQFQRETAALGPADSEGSPPREPGTKRPKRAVKKSRPTKPSKRRGRPPGRRKKSA